MNTPRLISLLLLVTFSLGGLASCGDPEEKDDKKARVVRTINLTFDRQLILPTSVLRFELGEDLSFANKNVVIRFNGGLGNGEMLDVQFVVPVKEDPVTLTYSAQLDVSKGLWAAVNADPEKTFTGTISLDVQDIIGTFARAEIKQVFTIFSKVTRPQISAITSATKTYPGQELEVRGAGFLRPDEGTTYAIVEQGTLTPNEGEPVDVTGQRIAMPWRGSRDVGALPILPNVFGIKPAVFDGKWRFENVYRDNQLFKGTKTVSVRTTLQKPFLLSVDPKEGSRSQVIRLTGRGFLPSPKGAEYGMLLKFEGSFEPDATPGNMIDYRGPRAITRTPFEVVSDSLIRQDVWYDVDRQNRQLTGLGAVPGVFRGQIIPILIYKGDEQIGDAWRGEFKVKPSKQVIHIRFVPGFTEALVRFGLENVERQVRERIFEVLRRDYDGINVVFVSSPPTDYSDYMTLEIGGPDPSGRGLLGYDNSFNGVPKDTGNLFLKDYLGGYNLDSMVAGFEPYGGVFIDSFTVFSPTLNEVGFDASPRFDEILAPFMPELGGTPVKATEWPEGGRVAAIQSAINLIGNLAGNTATHEIGHSLGLPFVPDEDPEKPQYHNQNPGERFIMDSGTERPFTERAELDGMGPARFNPVNKGYLKRILPPF